MTRPGDGRIIVSIRRKSRGLLFSEDATFYPFRPLVPDRIMRRKRKRIALIYDAALPYDVQVMSGVADYARQLDEWEIFIEERALNQQRLPDLSRWDGDGVIADFDHPQVARQVVASGLPVVAFGGGYGGYPLGSHVPCVLTDNAAISRLAFGHLSSRGFKNFGFFGYARDSTHGWSREREMAFRSLAEAGNCQLHAFHASINTGSNWQHFNDRAMRWLKSLPKPVGVMAATDKRARRLLEVCRAAKIRVPEEVAVIGVDNDRLLCELSFPPLTSIEQGTHEMGRCAGEILNRLLQGRPPKAIRTVVPPAGVVTRASTDTLATDDSDAARAMSLINEHACHGLTPQQVCREVGRSRVGLDERFKASFGRTLAKAILDARLARAHELVVSSSLPLKEVADRSGFRSVQHMTTLFRQHHNRTPAAIRQTRL